MCNEPTRTTAKAVTARAAICPIGLLVLSVLSSHAEVLLNPGFESGAGGRVSDWVWSGNTYQEPVHARSGSHSLKLFGNWTGPWNTSYALQNVAAEPGQRWTFTGYAKQVTGDLLGWDNYALLKIAWFDGTNGTGNLLQPLPGPGALHGQNAGVQSPSLNSGSAPDAWQELAVSAVAPPGTLSAQMVVLFAQPTDQAGAAWFDDVSALMDWPPLELSIVHTTNGLALRWNSIVSNRYQVFSGHTPDAINIPFGGSITAATWEVSVPITIQQQQFFRVEDHGKAAPLSLLVTKQGTGSGTVTSDPAGIDCGTDCEGAYAAGTPVTLTATPAADSLFEGWSGDATGTGPALVTMDASRSVTATFTLKQYTLTVQYTGNGTGSVRLSPPGGIYPAGTVVTLTAYPSGNSHFVGFGVTDCWDSPICDVTMDASKVVTAVFGIGPPP